MTKTDWQKLKPILTAKGLLTDMGNTRYATAKPCPRCGQTIIAGIDWEIEWLQPCPEIHADIEPISAQGELAALILERVTYDLVRDHAKGRWQMRSRTATSTGLLGSVAYRRNPIGTSRQRYDVVAGHECGSVLPRQPSITPEPTIHASDTPPF
ncbi:hypothetical protein [Cumulibacter soli]|uniref:hypothetical protein n=1 Tax=Cumulibacter soli TaxID=2546344 RepID=UPI0010679221|nr:hypothetical protein [Cumulibacter soli]